MAEIKEKLANPKNRDRENPQLAEDVKLRITVAADAEAGRRSLDHYLRAFTTHLGTDSLIAQLLAMQDDTVPALAERLGAIRQPTAIVWGERDPFLDVGVGERLRDAIPGATLEVIPDARHFTPEDAPERVAAAIGGLLER